MTMRMRLRAPDVPEAESSDDLSSENSITPSTPDRSPLFPPLDVGSSEYIEERLENLKRRPKWRDFLDQYVHEHPDSDSEDEGSEDPLTATLPDLIHSSLWSLLVAAFSPLLVLCAPFFKHNNYGFWPLGCHSMKELFGCALVNVFFMIFGVLMLYWTICRELPDFYNVQNTFEKIYAQIDEVQGAAMTCHAALLQWERTVAQELCMPIGIDATLLLLNVWLLLHHHRRWARYIMVVMALLFLVDVPTRLYDATFPAPKIFQVDPTFAMVNEELLVSLAGVNLKPGGSVAWVAYWGCATTSNVNACDKQFVSTFEAGIVAVIFKSLDHFIPCYRDPPNPLKAQDFQCFKNVRIRVKNTESIPGWSRSVSQTRFVKTEPSLRDEKQGIATTLVYRQEQLIDIEMMKVTDEARSVGSNKEFESIEERKSTPEIDQMEDKARPKSAQNEANGKLEEVEVTSDAEVRMLHIDIEVEMASHSRVSVASVESMQEPELKIDEFLPDENQDGPEVEWKER